MSSMPRDALKTSASKPGVIGVASSRLSAAARAITSCGSEMSAGVILFITSAAVYPSMRSAPTLKIWMTPFSSVAMLEKLALLKIALCNAPASSSASSACFRAVTSSMDDLEAGQVQGLGPERQTILLGHGCFPGLPYWTVGGQPVCYQVAPAQPPSATVAENPFFLLSLRA